MEPAKECVTTHGPNVVALKIDHVEVIIPVHCNLELRFVGRCIGANNLSTVKLPYGVYGTDLGWSSKTQVKRLKTRAEAVFVETSCVYE